MSGLPSTAGTTASVAFIRRGKIYVGHVGDSAIVLGSQSDKNDPAGPWLGRPLTRDHKPESVEESTRITNAGGKVRNYPKTVVEMAPTKPGLFANIFPKRTKKL